jgi:hypothetical protein
MTDSKQHKRLSKTLEICTLRQVALGHFIIFHARTRMGINKSTQRNLAHEAILSLVVGLNFMGGDGLKNMIPNRRSTRAYRPLKNDAKRYIGFFESAADLNVSDHGSVSVILFRTHSSHATARLLTGFAHNRLSLRLTRSEHHIRAMCAFSERSRNRAIGGDLKDCQTGRPNRYFRQKPLSGGAWEGSAT